MTTLIDPPSVAMLREQPLAHPIFPEKRVASLRDAHWLVRLRWIALLGQLATLGALRLIGAADLRMWPLLGVEAVILASNLGLFSLRRVPGLNGPWLIGPVLVGDTLLLTALLAFSGGPMNPYTIFFLVHVIMAAVLLDGRWTWGFVGLCSVCYGTLFWLVPVSHHAMHGDAFASHLYGMLSSFVIASICTGYFILLVQGERRRAEAQAAASQEVALKAESFAALTAVAAGAAHELATPLGTIAVAARELERAAGRITGGGGNVLAEDARLIREEVDRCRVILDALSPAFPGGDDAAQMAPEELMEAILARVSAARKGRVHVEPVRGSPIRLHRQRTTQAAAALLQNALDAGSGVVTVSCDCGEEGLAFRVADKGPGMSAAVQARLGEPFFSTKPQGRGLGLFLVRQFVEQVGGRLVIDSAEGKGTRVTLLLPPRGENR
jgi:two-component system sensor histidine kinase RegB